MKTALAASLLMLAGSLTQPLHAQTPSRPSFDGIWQVDYLYSLAGRNESMAPIDGSPIPFQPWADALHRGYLRDQRAGNPWGENNQRCLVAGTVRAMKGNFPWRLIETPEEIVILFEEDGRVNLFPFQTEHRKDLQPTWHGDSIARWEGDTLVIDTIATNGKTPLPHAVYVTTNLHVTQRLRLLPGGKQMEALIEIDDPGAFTRKFTARSVFNRLPDDYKLADYRCAENNKDIPKDVMWWDAYWGPE